MHLRRRDSTTSNETLPNTTLLAPTDNFSVIIKKFHDVGLSITDVVTLSDIYQFVL